MRHNTYTTAGRKGGLSRSETKISASRANGAKGGRPKKLIAAIVKKIKRQLKTP
jgi:hypothetical protein